ncbi:acetyltransferase [Moraxella caviae]|uniref:Acetyltransferase n=1 Tax=Moraxella caviae TaxID=34060 RepID=A0A1T0A116_9GAMM|nr:sugar O-acetyltransferase [Moraxella caviae]OOR89456.1 acetyltransferase [Moraxella caviae]STZ09820.1 Galactoside O-acetyltransferase [Moraxella caviae]
MHDFPLNQLLAKESPEFADIHQIVAENQPLLAKLKFKSLSAVEIRQVLGELTQSEIDESLVVNLPFYCDFGRHLRIGKNVFINIGATFSDVGGIIIEDNVLIAPNVTITSVNHPLDPATRRGIILAPVRICKNAWIGANATIVGGVTIGENSVVAAGAVVTKDVPANTVVAGVPARVVKEIEA